MAVGSLWAGPSTGCPMSKFDNPLYLLRRGELRMSVSEFADWAGVHPSTIRRQESGRSEVCPLLYRLASLRAGDLSVIHPAWHGWHIDSDGDLFNPFGWRRGFRPGDINALVFSSHHVRALQARIKVLERRLFLLAPANDGLRLQRLSPAPSSDYLG